jgi:hypothetical protein
MNFCLPPLGFALLVRAALGLLSVSFATTQTWAQTIRVQSGEHADFTRLVLDIGASRSWRLEREGEVTRLRLDPPVDGFDITRVFDLIPRTRLAGLLVRDGLELSLACPCDIEASRFQGRYLLLDIRLAEDQGRPVDPLQIARRDAAGQLPDTARLLFGPPRDPSQPEDPVSPPPTMIPGIAREDPAAVDLQEVARIMSEQLARAAAAGLLDASADRPMTDADPVRDLAVSSGDQTPSRPTAGGAPMPVLPPGIPLRAETALDRALPLPLMIQPRQDGLGCTGAALGLHDGSPTGSLQEGLGALRLALFDERDQLQPDGVVALARHYLAFGFGAEAAYWLAQIDTPPPSMPVIASLVDEVPGPHFPPEPDPLACSDDELLWRYLDGAFDPTTLTSEEAGRLQRATAALPHDLRDQIAPRMARALDRDGFVNEARNLRDMLWRSDRLGPGALLRLDRDLGLAPADPDSTAEGLAMALRDAGGEPVAAMTHAMAFDREIGVPPSTLRLDAAEALLRENGIGQITLPLWTEIVLARAAIGDLNRMLELLAAEGLPEGARDHALTALFSERVAGADTPAVFLLAHVFGPNWQATGSEAGRARVAAIAHLREEGLTEAAEMLRMRQRMLILPARPEADADGSDDLRSAWQAGDWSRLGDLATGTHRAIAARMEGAPPADQAADADRLVRDLPRLAERVADSRVLRDEITALLGAPRPAPSEGSQ